MSFEHAIIFGLLAALGLFVLWQPVRALKQQRDAPHLERLVSSASVARDAPTRMQLRLSAAPVGKLIRALRVDAGGGEVIDDQAQPVARRDLHIALVRALLLEGRTQEARKAVRLQMQEVYGQDKQQPPSREDRLAMLISQTRIAVHEAHKREAGSIARHSADRAVSGLFQEMADLRLRGLRQRLDAGDPLAAAELARELPQRSTEKAQSGCLTDPRFRDHGALLWLELCGRLGEAIALVRQALAIVDAAPAAQTDAEAPELAGRFRDWLSAKRAGDMLTIGPDASLDDRLDARRARDAGQTIVMPRESEHLLSTAQLARDLHSAGRAHDALPFAKEWCDTARVALGRVEDPPGSPAVDLIYALWTLWCIQRDLDHRHAAEQTLSELAPMATRLAEDLDQGRPFEADWSIDSARDYFLDPHYGYGWSTRDLLVQIGRTDLAMRLMEQQIETLDRDIAAAKPGANNLTATIKERDEAQSWLAAHRR
ncbi:hypothetical protein [Nioella sp. MMSF_3534]|uniref:hypothetical protein n=1 Tax=Nioella sp. MMSF_3534 TaxID=3046720 RepID=UPI002740007C|nr:hypothetical protein [Nioella sp. MMSF_3534]